MKLLVDMNLSPRWIGVLEDAGHEAVHWAAIGAGNATDVEIMAHAAAHDFVVPTQDLDFGSILAVTGGQRPSVIQIRTDDLSPDVIGHQVVAAIRQTEADLRDGALLSIDASRARLRVLPLRSI
jgi:predicted nuclease of predicted toxin-antitoxin system